MLSNNAEGKSGVFFRNIPIQVIHIPMHTAVIIPTDRQFLKHDLFRQKTVTIIAAAKWDTSPFVKLDAFVKHQQLKLPVLKQPARTDTVQPKIGHQQGERLVQLQAAFKNVHFSAERRIRYNNIPTIRLVSKKILFDIYMRVFYLKSGFLQMKHELAVARVKRAHMIFPSGRYLMMGATPYPGVYFSSLQFKNILLNLLGTDSSFRFLRPVIPVIETETQLPDILPIIFKVQINRLCLIRTP